MNRGRPFEAGNTFGRGRPKGSKNKSTSVGWGILEQHEESLITKNVVESLKTDTKSRLWCSEKLLQGKPRTPKLKLPAIKTLDDVAKALDVVLQAVANHKCTAADGQALFVMLGERRKMIETQELTPRLEELEAALKKLGSK
jgi:hypothetical protein